MAIFEAKPLGDKTGFKFAEETEEMQYGNIAETAT